MRTAIAMMISIALFVSTLEWDTAAHADAVTDGEACLAANRAREYGNAVDLCTRALASTGLADDQRAVALTNRAFAYRRQGDDSRALRDLDEAIALWPDYLVAYWDRARARVTAGNYSGAIEDYNKVGTSGNSGKLIGAVPKSEYFAARGDAYFLAGNLDQAIEDYSKSISFMEGRTPYRERGIAYFLKGDQRRAAADFSVDLEMYKTARVMTPPDAILWLGVVQIERSGDVAAAVQKSAAGFNLDIWPGPVVRYYQSSMTKAEVVRAAGSADAHAGQFPDCGAVFYVGMFDLLTGRDGAKAELQQARDTCPKPMVEGPAAGILLSKQ